LHAIPKLIEPPSIAIMPKSMREYEDAFEGPLPREPKDKEEKTKAPTADKKEKEPEVHSELINNYYVIAFFALLVKKP